MFRISLIRTSVFILVMYLTVVSETTSGTYSFAVNNNCGKAVTRISITLQNGNVVAAGAPLPWMAGFANEHASYFAGTIPTYSTIGGFSFTSTGDPVTFTWQVEFFDGSNSGVLGPVTWPSRAAAEYVLSPDCSSPGTAPLLGTTTLVLLVAALLLSGGLAIRYRRAPRT
jgi:hypothetical protein